jgi:hypothetical protein
MTTIPTTKYAKSAGVGEQTLEGLSGEWLLHAVASR